MNLVQMKKMMMAFAVISSPVVISEMISTNNVEASDKTGWIKSGTGAWYYYDAKGNMVKNKWIGNYYVGSTGVMETSKWIGNYYVDTTGKWVSTRKVESKKTGWQKEGTIWYYYNEKGNKEKNKWVGNYYLGSTGVMETSKWIGNYYVDENGKWNPAARKAEVVKKTGWQKEGTVWYYYDEKGNRVKNKWVGNYYVGSTGVMETSKWIGNYYVDENGKWDPTARKGNAVTGNKVVNKIPKYYSQKDPRWSKQKFGRYTFGGTGCVPTSLAMIIEAETGVTTLPTEVGAYLYSQGYYNKKELGTISTGIAVGARRYGFNTRGLGNVTEISESLKNGNFIMVAVSGGTPFARAGYTHEMVLSGYNNGKTYVSDPYNKANNGWYSIQYLYNIQSMVAEDRLTGFTFHEIYR